MTSLGMENASMMPRQETVLLMMLSGLPNGQIQMLGMVSKLKPCIMLSKTTIKDSFGQSVVTLI